MNTWLSPRKLKCLCFYGWLIFLLFLFYGRNSDIESREGRRTPRLLRNGNYYDKKCAKQSLGAACSEKINISSDVDANMSENQVIFLETSGRDWLLPRQGCAVESAARVSGLPVKVFIAPHSLDLTDNVTCHLHRRLPSVTFLHIDLDVVFHSTPLLALHRAGTLARSKFKATHLSDMVRLALVWKYGGMYLDLDMIVLEDLTSHVNVIGTSTATLASTGEVREARYNRIPNSAFHFKKHHPVLWTAMAIVAREFRGDLRAEVGPTVIRRAILHFKDVATFSRIRSNSALRLAKPRVFNPVKYYEVERLWAVNETSEDAWRSLWKGAITVHFFSSQSSRWLLRRDPKHEAYAILGPENCPLAYWADPDF